MKNPWGTMQRLVGVSGGNRQNVAGVFGTLKKNLVKS
jgi:hypothetical protein